MDVERLAADAVTIYLLWQSNRIFAVQGPVVPPVNWKGRLRAALRYWPMVSMAVLAAVIVTQPYFAQYLNRDPRLEPLARAALFDGLPTDPSESFVMLCFPYDPLSCNITAQYRDRFADHWTTEMTRFGLDNPPHVTGISIVTQSETRPPGALSLRAKLRSLGFDAEFSIDPTGTIGPLKQNEFAIIIGAKS